MALDYALRYPGQIDTTDPNGYPQGKAKNISSPGSGDGTPYEKDLVNDLFGLLQALLFRGSVTPSGVSDSATASDYFTALRKAVIGPMAVANWVARAAQGTGAFNDVHYSESADLFVAVGDAAYIETAREAVQNWTTRAFAGSADMYGVWFSQALGVWVAVGGPSGTPVIETSANGTTGWTNETPAATAQLLRSVVSAESIPLLVAVGNIGTIQTSPDGSAWTSRASGHSNTFHGVAYSVGLTRFIAVGNGGQISQSTDGLTWGTIASSAGLGFEDVAYSEQLKLWCAVGTNGLIETSITGLGSWTQQTSAAGTDFNAVEYSEQLGMFVAVGGSGEIEVSRDGKSWTLVSANGNNSLEGLTYSIKRGMFVAAGASQDLQTSLMAGF